MLITAQRVKSVSLRRFSGHEGQLTPRMVVQTESDIHVMSFLRIRPRVDGEASLTLLKHA
jgi:hypothetical protein